jgi:hypothetical protein
MITFLAQLFRGLHHIVGISAPPPGASDRKFVFAWLGGIAVIARPKEVAALIEEAALHVR